MGLARIGGDEGVARERARIELARDGARVALMGGMKRTMFMLAVVGVVGCSGAAVDRATTDGGGDTPTPTSTPPAPGEGTGDGGASEETNDGGALVASGDDGSTPPSGSQGDGAPPSAPPSSGGVFADAGAYVPTLGPSARNPKHTGSQNPAGQACLSCHGGQRPNVVQFLFAGTVWNAPAASAATPMAEVRVVQASGAALSAYSDADGNFFFVRGANGPLAPPVAGGVRDAKATALMTNVFNDGDCNSCHRLGGEVPVNLP